MSMINTPAPHSSPETTKQSQTPGELADVLAHAEENFYQKIFWAHYHPDAKVDFWALAELIKKTSRHYRWNRRGEAPLQVCETYAQDPLPDYSFSTLTSETRSLWNLKALFWLISPQALYNKFWPQMLLWLTWGKRDDDPHDEERKKSLQESKKILIEQWCGWDASRLDLLGRIVAGQRWVFYESNVFDILKQWDFTHSLTTTSDTLPKQISFVKLMTQSTRWRWAAEGWNFVHRGYEAHDVYLDGPVGLCLFHEWKPLAYVTFFVFGDALLINEMQRHSYSVFDVHWRKIQSTHDPIVDTLDRKSSLLDKLSTHAKNLWLHEIVIQSWQNNKWLKDEWKYVVENRDTGQRHEVPTGDMHLTLATAQKVYDDYARQHGYTQDPTDHNRHKPL